MAIVVNRKMPVRREYSALVPHLDSLYGVYKALRKQRLQRGAIDFDTMEARIEFGPDKKIERVIPMERNDAHRLIEECMIAANVCAARFLLRHKVPGLYRVHDGPSPDRLQDVRAFLGELALSIGGGDEPTSKDYAKLVDTIRDRADTHLIQMVLLRSLAQAVYSPDNTGHFGLAHDAYTHFTSPIRRYPDLLVHRAIRHIIRNAELSTFHYSHSDMIGLGEHCSMTERRADDATRDAIDWLKCEFMLDKVGDEFEGVIAAVTSFGVFVELSEILVEGLLHITSLASDYYEFDPVAHRLQGKRSGRSYRLGDPLRVRVARVDLDERKIDFELAETSDRLSRTRRKRARRGRKFN